MIFQYVLLFGIIFAFVFIALLIYHYNLLNDKFNLNVDIQNEVNLKQHIINNELITSTNTIIDVIQNIDEDVANLTLKPKKNKLHIYSSPIVNND